MLLAQKAYVEGAFDLGLYAARLFDDTHTLGSAAERNDALQLRDSLTPVVKSWPSHYGLKANELAIQVLGGHGYTRDYPLEQDYRDNRLNAMHEHTHGIQSLDLLARKVPNHNGAALKRLLALMLRSCQQASAEPELDALRLPFEQLLARLQSVTLALLSDLLSAQVTQALATSALYLHAFGHAVIGWRWLKQARNAHAGLARSSDLGEQHVYQGKLQAARFF